jgi:steroid Delta-isomerase
VPSPDEIRATIDRYIQCMSAGDRQGWLDLWTPDASIEDPVGTEVRVGHEQLGEFWDFVHQLSESIELVRTGPIRVAGSEAAFPMQAINDLGGTKMAVDIIDVMVFDDEARITAMRAFWDAAELHPYTG